MIRRSLIAACALSLLSGAAWAETWTGGDDLPTNPLACDGTPGAAVAKPYDGGEPTNAPDRKGKKITVKGSSDVARARNFYARFVGH